MPLGRLSQRQVQCPFCIPPANQLNINFLLHFLIRELLKSNLYRLIHFFLSPFSFFPLLPIYRPSAFIFTSIFLFSLRRFICLSIFLSLCLTFLLLLFFFCLYFYLFLVSRVARKCRVCLCGISTGDTCF